VRDHERLVSAYERRDEAAAMSVAREIVEESLAAMQRNKWNGLTP
jgi:DNA-binding GntR family transcriptional regulator